jgi:hypothetical protein
VELWLKSKISNCKYPVELFVGKAKVVILTGQTTKNNNEMKSYIAVFPGAENAFDKTPIFGLACTVMEMHSSNYMYSIQLNNSFIQNITFRQKLNQCMPKQN